MAKENLFDKIKKNLKGDDDQDQDPDKSAFETVIIDGKKVTVPKYIAINLKQNQKNK